jgi:hypothetical protein
MIGEQHRCQIHEAFARYNDADERMRAFNPQYQRALARNKVTPALRDRKSVLCKELREAYKALRTELFLAGELHVEQWNEQRAVLQAADNHGE